MSNITIESVKEAIYSLGKELEEVESICIIGSLARKVDFDIKKSDIDIVVIVDRKDRDVDMIWYQRINKVLREFNRNITVLVYSLQGLKNISNWYVLRLASEGVVIFDKGNINELFAKIIQSAKDAGLVEEEIGNQRVWKAKGLKLGDIIEVKVK